MTKIVEIICFVPDSRKQGGEYVTIIVTVKKADKERKIADIIAI